MFFHHSPETLSDPERHNGTPPSLEACALPSAPTCAGTAAQATPTPWANGWGNWGKQMGMDQYLYIPFLVGWTSIYQLFWCSPGVQGFDTLPFVFGWCEQLCFVCEFGLTFAICISWHVLRHSWKNRPIFSVSKEHIDTWALQMLGTCNLYICICIYIYISRSLFPMA